MLLVIASFAVVSASEQAPAAGNGGYIVEPSLGNNKEPFAIDTVYATITQGRTNWHTKVVSTFITTLNVDLNWGNPANSLRLKIYSPDGYTFGPYYDSFDGTTNGRINLNIINNNGIAQGTWYYEVYGYSVTGTEDYSI
jgi:hypothetical protein